MSELIEYKNFNDKKMDENLNKLSDQQLDEFLHLSSSRSDKINYAKSLINKINNLPEDQKQDVKISYPIADLFIAQQVEPTIERKTYTEEQINNLNYEEIIQFSEIFGLKSSDSDKTNKERIYRILDFMNLIERGSTYAESIFTQPNIMQRLCDELSFKELKNLRETNKLQQDLNCKIKVNTPEGIINELDGFNSTTIKVYNIIKSYLSSAWLYYAIKTRDLGVVKYFVDHGVKIEKAEFAGKYNYVTKRDNPLILAVEQRYPDMVKYLIEKGAKIDSVNEYGHSALMFAVEINDFDIVKILADNGADVNFSIIVDFNTKTPLSYAIERDNFDIIKYLVEKGAKVGDKEINQPDIRSDIKEYLEEHKTESSIPIFDPYAYSPSFPMNIN